MAKSQQLGVRIDRPAVEALDRMRQATGLSEADLIRSLIPNEQWANVLVDRVRFTSGSTRAALYTLASEGLKRLIQQSHKPINNIYLDMLPPDVVAELYMQWADGMATDAKIPGPLGNRFRLQEGEFGFLPIPV